MTKDTGDFRQFRSVACREYTLPRDDPASQPKGWIQGNTRIGPILEVTTSFQHFKCGIEIRIESVNKDSSHSWVRISYGTVKYVIDSIEDNTEISADSQEEPVSQTSTSVVAARSKAKSKTSTEENLLGRQQPYQYTKDDPTSEAKGWIQGNMRIGPVFKVTTSFQNGKHGIEIRIWPVSQDNSHSSVEYLMERSNTWLTRITKFLQIHMKIKRHKQVSRLLHPDQRQKQNHKEEKLLIVPSIIPMHERRWIDIEPSEPTLAAYEVSKKVISLLRHNQTVQREEDGAIQFWRIKFHLRNQFSQVQHWSDERWKSCLGRRRRFKNEISALLW